MRVLVTGVNGLVGRALCPILEQSGHKALRVVRKASGASEFEIGEIGSRTDWAFLRSIQVDAVVHLAARVHIMHSEGEAAISACREINTLGTLNFAKQCAAAGIKRFVFVSSVKVMGEGRTLPYCATDPACPQGPYALSKLEAEQGLLDLASQTGMEVVIVRPPLVYGPGVGANFLRLVRSVDRGVPLPFGAIDNRRSFIYVRNLVDALIICLIHPAAAGKTYLVSDGEEISTPELLRRVGDALGRPARLIAAPPWAMALAGRLVGKKQEVERLLGSLFVDISPFCSDTGWVPRYTMQTGLAAMVQWYRQSELDRGDDEATL